MLKREQQALYRPLVDRAWTIECGKIPASRDNLAARERWYRQALLDAGGWYTSKQCNPAADFDRLMLHFAKLADDAYWIDKASKGAERRLLYWIRRRMSDLGALQGREVDWPYTRAIMTHMNLPLDVVDCPADLLQKVFVALDKEVKRLRRKGNPIAA